MSPPVLTPLAIVIQQIITNANNLVIVNEETKNNQNIYRQTALDNGPQAPQR